MGDLLSFAFHSRFERELAGRPELDDQAFYEAHYGGSGIPGDIPITMEEQAQKALDCYNAGATVLHLHVRELDGKGSKRLSKVSTAPSGTARTKFAMS